MATDYPNLTIQTGKRKSELLPCPFCGGEVRVWNNLETENYDVECQRCGCDFQQHYGCEDEAIIAWNTRTQGVICDSFKPAADVAEVKHGEWLPDYETFVDEWERESEPIQTGWVCSLCGRQEFNREPYCHCGAKMDGGKK